MELRTLERAGFTVTQRYRDALNYIFGISIYNRTTTNPFLFLSVTLVAVEIGPVLTHVNPWKQRKPGSDL